MHHEMERVHYVTMAQQCGMAAENLSPGQTRPMVRVLHLEARLNEKILVAFMAGREAERVEALSDDEIKSEVLASLQSMFGKVIPTPDAMLITRQQQNEFTRGS